MVEQTASPVLAREARLVEQAKTDDQAFAILYNFYFPRIYGYVFKRVGRREISEDIVSETFLKVFGSLKTYRAQGHSFGAWVYKIATNQLIDYYRQAGRRKETDLVAANNLASLERPAGEAVDSAYAGEIVRAVLIGLPQRYQAVLHLKFFAELSNEEIATSLGLKVNNVRVLTHRALKSFQKAYEIYAKKSI